MSCFPYTIVFCNANIGLVVRDLTFVSPMWRPHDVRAASVIVVDSSAD
jgi:hypothetical protein